MTPHYTLFISDLHLQANQPLLTQLFMQLLKTRAKNADALYILGDFFEIWVGDDDQSSFNQSIMTALKDLSITGVPIYLMTGNRDFLLGECFAKAAGATLLSEPSLINLYGTPTLLLHGDSLCTQDVRHQHFRRFSRSTIMKGFFKFLPLRWRRRIAQRIRHASQRYQQQIYYPIDVTPAAVNEIMQQYNVKRLIHGHTHQAKIETWQIHNEPAQRIVLGAWHQVGNVLVCEENGTFKFEEFFLQE